ncbi:MAG: putative NRPS-like protein biosynthetic cluster [Cirrosporium novae-zelandiae]|nr:MAG: putative NRPS-like protein biosynthetic cluster [Cirrosporium novae-zelandiae]
MVFQPDAYYDIPFVDLLSWTLDNLTYDEDKDIFIDAADDTRRLTARQARTLVRKLVGGLKEIGVKPGDCICLHSFNDILYSPIYLGIIGAGGRFVGSNPGYTYLELHHLLSTSKTRFIIVEPELLEKILPAAHDFGIPDSNILIFNPRRASIPDGFVSWETLLQHGESDWIRFDDEQTAKNTTAALLSTSGTTGLPKAAAISHFAHVAQSKLLYDSKDKPYQVSRLLCLPQFHAFAAPLVHIAPLREGHTTYIMRRFDLEKYMGCIKRYQITETAMVPPIMASVSESALAKTGLISSLRYIWCAGAPLSTSINRQMMNLLDPNAIISQVWGMTEIGWITTFLFPERDESNSVGRLLPNMEAKLIDRNGKEVTKECCSGEIYVRGPSIMSSYLGNPEATSASFEDGWLKTGDIAYCKSGKWYIIDRVKDLIKVRGWQVSPAELESCLLMHPRIIDAAVVGIQNSTHDSELPRAFVVVDPDSPYPVKEKEIKSFVRARLAKYKALDGGVRFVKSIPRNASGKILRPMLINGTMIEWEDKSNSQGPSNPIAKKKLRVRLSRRLLSFMGKTSRAFNSMRAKY